MNENYKIYVHIFPNGKLYIGQTRQSLKNRFGKNGYNYKGCKRMSDAICEFGWDNIIHLLLFDNLTYEIADIIEIELIKKYKTYDINYGYNMTLGGKDGIYKIKYLIIRMRLLISLMNMKIHLSQLRNMDMEYIYV